MTPKGLFEINSPLDRLATRLKVEMGHTHIECLLTSEPQIENFVRQLQSANLNLLWCDSPNFSSSQFDRFFFFADLQILSH
jgi:hypothetical protein